MRGAWLTLLLAACGGAPAPVVTAAQPAPPAAPPVAALQAGSPWVLSAGAVALGELTYRWMHFTPNGALIATGPLGVVSLEPNGPGETLLRPLPTGAELYDMTYAGRWALLQWAEIVEGVRKLHIDVLDVDSVKAQQQVAAGTRTVGRACVRVSRSRVKHVEVLVS